MSTRLHFELLVQFTPLRLQLLLHVLLHTKVTTMSPEVKAKSAFPKRLQSPLRPSPHRTTSQISSISVEANSTDPEPTGRALLSQDSKYIRQRTLSHPHARQNVSSVAEPIVTEVSATTTKVSPTAAPAPVVQRTLSAPGTPGRGSASITSVGSSSRAPSVYSLSVPAVFASASVSGVGSASGGSSPSRKGKERALEDVEVEGVDVEGELVTGNDGDATKGLRELVRRSTIADPGGVPWRKPGRSRASTLKGEHKVPVPDFGHILGT
jgi:hypothetical protein